jgi:hypothetical protein
MIVKRNYYSEKEQVEDPKKKRKLANAAGVSLIGMGGALTGGSKLMKKVQKDLGGLSAKQIKEKFPKLTEKQIEKYMRTATKPETLKKAGRLGYASMAAGAATLGASLYNKKKKAKEKEFADKDYKGLSKNGAKELREVRNKLAEDLLKEREIGRYRSSYYVRSGALGNKYIDIGDENLKNLAKNGLTSESERLDTTRKLAQSRAELARNKILDRELSQSAKRQKLAEQLRRKKNLKIAGKTALGIGLASGLAVGAKKLYDKRRKAAKDDNTEK